MLCGKIQRVVRISSAWILELAQFYLAPRFPPLEVNLLSSQHRKFLLDAEIQTNLTSIAKTSVCSCCFFSETSQPLSLLLHYEVRRIIYEHVPQPISNNLFRREREKKLQRFISEFILSADILHKMQANGSIQFIKCLKIDKFISIKYWWQISKISFEIGFMDKENRKIFE